MIVEKVSRNDGQKSQDKRPAVQMSRRKCQNAH